MGMNLLRTCASTVLLWLLFLPMALAGVNVNTASSAELESLPGIGPSKAGAIIQYRTEHGQFTSLTDLDNVPGIGPATLQNISPLVVFDGNTELPESGKALAANVATALPVADGGTVNINTAGQTELEGLPGIGPSKAAAILQFRYDNGSFATCSELVRVKGIGDATLRNVSPRCTTGE
jgi:competence protein ComEA